MDRDCIISVSKAIIRTAVHIHYIYREKTSCPSEEEKFIMPTSVPL